LSPFDPVAHAPPGTEDQDRNRRSAFPQALEHVKAVQVGQPEVQDRERDAGVG